MGSTTESSTDSDTTSTDATRPEVTMQASFATTDDDSGPQEYLETPDTAETTLEDYGADIDHTNRETRIDRPEASTFGVDDRAVGGAGDTGEQQPLFPDAPDDQQTLDGEQANTQSMFDVGGDSGQGEGGDSGDASTPDPE